MTRQILAVLFAGIIFSAFLFERNDAGLIKLKKIAKIALIAKALTPKKIPLPLLLPLPIPLFKENVHHAPYPVHHHSKAVVGIGYEHGGYGGGHGGYGGGHGNGLEGLEGGHGWW